MARKKILYISGSIGLGHVSKDIAIAKKIKAQNPHVEITWLAADPATRLKHDICSFLKIDLRLNKMQGIMEV